MFAMHDLSVSDLTVGNECFLALQSQKFNKSKKKAAFRVKNKIKIKCHCQFLITSKSFLLRSQGWA